MKLLKKLMAVVLTIALLIACLPSDTRRVYAEGEQGAETGETIPTENEENDDGEVDDEIPPEGQEEEDPPADTGEEEPPVIDETEEEEGQEDPDVLPAEEEEEITVAPAEVEVKLDKEDDDPSGDDDDEDETWEDPNKDDVHIVDDDSLLDPEKEETEDDPYYDNGTYTNQQLLENGDYYVRKQFDWTDKENGEGKITFRTKLNVTKAPTIAVYAFTPCEAHGFRLQTALRNIEYLLRNYDRVDLIYVTGEYKQIPFATNASGTSITNVYVWVHDYDDIHIVKDVGSDSDNNGKADFLDILQIGINDDGSTYYDSTPSAWSGDKGLGHKYWAQTYGTSTGHNGVHFGISLYTGLYAYFADVDPSSLSSNPTATLTNAVNEPTAIYVSFDGLLDTRTAPSGVPYVQEQDPLRHSNAFLYNSNWSYPLVNYSCWDILKQLDQQGRYYSLGMNGNGNENEFVFATGSGTNSYLKTGNIDSVHNDPLHANSLHYGMWNELLALSDPSIFEDRNGDDSLTKDDIPTNALWNGVKRTSAYVTPSGTTYATFKNENQKYHFDYNYQQTFEDLDMPVVGITLDDTLSSSFEVNGNVSSIECEIIYPEDTAEEDKITTVNPTISGNKVSFSVNSYIKGTELVFTIPVKIDDSQPIDINQWIETNGDASLNINLGEGEDAQYDITSPEAHVEGYIIETEVIGGTITPSGGIREGGDRTIEYAPNEGTDTYYELQYIEIDGVRYEGDDLADILNSYLFENVQSDHKIKVVYAEFFDLSGTKTWNDGGIEHDNAEDIVITVTRKYNDGTEHTETLSDVEVVWDGNDYSITHLPVYQDEARQYKYTYTISESLTDAALEKLHAKEGYEDAEYDDPVVNGYDITNNLKNETTDFEGLKIWDDGKTSHDNAAELKLVLYVESKYNDEGEPTNKTQINYLYPDALSWDGDTFRYTGLKKYDSEGNLNVYSVRESNINGTATQNTDYSVYYDGVLWDYDSYSSPAEAFRVTAYETIRNAISISIPITKTWVDGSNQDNTRPDSITVELYANGEKVAELVLTAPEDDPDADVWEGVFEDLPKYDENGEIHYEVREPEIEGYGSVVEKGEDISSYEYPTNVSDEEPDLATMVTDPITITNGYDWKVQEGLRIDEIDGTSVVFNNANMKVADAELQVYDPNGNLVPKNDWMFTIENFNISGNKKTLVYNQDKDPDNKNATAVSVLNCRYYFTLTFKDAVVILDGSENGSKADVVMTVTNVSVVKTKNNYKKAALFQGAITAEGGYQLLGVSMDLNFKIPGVDTGTILLSFADIDVIGGQNVGGGVDRREAVFLGDGFEKTIYTLPLSNKTNANYKDGNAETRTIAGSTSTQSGPFTRFQVVENGAYMRAFSLKQDGSLGSNNGTLQSGFVARAQLRESGFNLRWTGSSCGTFLLNQVKPFKVKATVDEKTTGYTGGDITDPTNWRFRNYGEPLLYTITPAEGYHVEYLKIDGEYIDLSAFGEEGKQVVNTGWTRENDPNNINNSKEDVTIYQRADGVIDVYLPAQFYANGTNLDVAGERTDHWIDTSFASNGTASSYTITNTLLTQIEGTKTWVSGSTEHITNPELTPLFKLTRDGEDYPFDVSQVVWDGDHYTITGLPAYAEDGHKYVYELTETPPAGYEVTQDGFDLINTLKQQPITIQGKKTWNDGGREHDNSKDLIITLYRATWSVDDNKYGEPEALDWPIVWEDDTYKFIDLPRYDELRYEYKYTVTEEFSEEFLASLDEGDEYTCVTDSTGRNFINTLTGKISFSGTKTWVDAGKEHNNETDLTLVLYRESVDVNKRQVNNMTPTWDGNRFTYTDLDKYDEHGHPFTYSVRESRIMIDDELQTTYNLELEYEIYYDGTQWVWDGTHGPNSNDDDTAYQSDNTIKNVSKVTDLYILKKVPAEYIVDGFDETMAVFAVEIKRKNEEGSYERIYYAEKGLVMSQDNWTVTDDDGNYYYYQIKLEDIPYKPGDIVTVSEIYSSGYTPDPSSVTAEVVEFTDEETGNVVRYLKAEFTNEFDGPPTPPTPVIGAVNAYTWSNGQISWSQKTDFKPDELPEPAAGSDDDDTGGGEEDPVPGEEGGR